MLPGPQRMRGFVIESAITMRKFLRLVALACFALGVVGAIEWSYLPDLANGSISRQASGFVQGAWLASGGTTGAMFLAFATMIDLMAGIYGALPELDEDDDELDDPSEHGSELEARLAALERRLAEDGSGLP